MLKRRHVTAYILAGGASSRMGRDKGLLEFGGVPLIVRTARVVRPLAARVLVVGGPRDYARFGLRSIPDRCYAAKKREETRLGPLAGIATALSHTRSVWNLILACDLPFLTTAWLDWMLARALDSSAEIVIPRTRRGLEPLAAVYRREAGATFTNALKHGERKVQDVLKTLRLDVVQAGDWRDIDPDGLVLKNVNTPGDYRMALRRWTSHRRAL